MGDRVLLTLGMSSGVGLLPLVHPGAEAAIAWVGVNFATPAADEIVIMGLFDYPGSEFLVSIHDSNEEFTVWRVSLLKEEGPMSKDHMRLIE